MMTNAQQQGAGFFFEISRLVATPVAELGRILPSHFRLVEEGSDVFPVVTSVGSVEVTALEVQRECDRIRFLTGEDLLPLFTCELRGDGSRQCSLVLTSNAQIVAPLSPAVGQQVWTGSLL